MKGRTACQFTCFSPSELVFAHMVQGPLSVIHDQWVALDPDYEAGELAKQNLQVAQLKMKQLFGRNVERREFWSGDQVLVCSQ